MSQNNKQTSNGVDSTYSLLNGTRTKTPRVPFLAIKEQILKKRYNLSVVLVGDARMRSLNKMYRGKDATTDVLAFPLSKNSGEIFISQKAAAKKSKLFALTEREYLIYIFIHGLLHLKGMDHGRTMEKSEDTWCRRFNVLLPKQ